MIWKWLWTENSPHTNEKYIRGGPEIRMQVNKILHPEIDPLVEEEIKVVIDGITIIETIIDQIIEIDQEADGTTTDQVIEVAITRTTIDEVIWDQITDKMPNGLLETEVEVGIEMNITIMTIQEVEVELDMITGPFSREEKSLGPDLTPGWVLSMIT